MKTKRVTFQNKTGYTLSARLELPVDRHPKACAIFAHCFTCSKNLNAVTNISRALTKNGIAVLRFDFTGLGESEGDFADTSFSTNIDDLISAADYIGGNYESPSILIGHSLGGAAVLVAASRLESVKAVATIGAPYNPAHVKHLFASDIDKIEADGEAKVNLAGRPFTIKKQFLDDVDKANSKDNIRSLGKALLVLHSPQDETVSIDNATSIYKAAKHPRSFVSLDGADHLLTNKKDSVYVGEVISSWASRYVEVAEEDDLKTSQQVVVETTQDGYTTQINAGGHRLTADEPESVGGNNFGPTPYGYLLSALGACTSMTLRMYADRKKWVLKEVRVHLSHEKIYKQDCEECDTRDSKIDTIERQIELVGNLDEEQKQRLLEIADRCPVHKTLHTKMKIITYLK